MLQRSIPAALRAFACSWNPSAALGRRWLSAGTSGTAAPEDEVDADPSPSALDDFRQAYGFRRRPDGRVQVVAPSGEWYDFKLDGRVEGSLLLREPTRGHVYYLISEDIKQVDLTNDLLVARLLGDGGWDALKQPLMAHQAPAAAGAGADERVHLRLSPSQFKSVFTLLQPGAGTGAGTGAGAGGGPAAAAKPA